MKKPFAQKNVLAALSAGAALITVSTTHASIITLDGPTIETAASMYSDAGGMGSEIMVPTDSLSPWESFGFGPSHSHNDGIGVSTSSVSQEFDVMQIDGMPAFSLVTQASGAFAPLHVFPFSGSVGSIVETSITFHAATNASVELEGTVQTTADVLPDRGSTHLISTIRLIKVGGDEPSNCCEVHGGIGCNDSSCQSLICAADPFCCDVAWDSLCVNAAEESCAACGEDEVLCEWIGADDPFLCAVDLVEGQTYRLDVAAYVEGHFESVIDDTYLFSADSQLLFVMLPPDPPQCELQIDEPDACIAQGDETTISAEVFDGLAPFEFDWNFESGSDWVVTGGQGSGEVTVKAGSDIEAQLCLHVTDDINQVGECCITLCRVVDDLKCDLELEGPDECLDSRESTAVVNANVSGGAPPYDLDWEITSGDWTIVNELNGAAEVQPGEDLNAQLCLIVTDTIKGNETSCCINLCREPEPDELACTLELSESDECLESPGDTALVTAAASGGVPPLQFVTWEFTTGDWTILENFNDTVKVEAGEDLQATLCATVNDQAGESSMCCIELCIEEIDIDDLVCDIPEPLPCIDSPGAVVPVTASAAGGLAPYAFDWSVTNGWKIISGQGTASVQVKAGEAATAELCVLVTDAMENGAECCVTLEHSASGCEGCTPGYWKQPHHFANWPPQYVPNQLFADVFDNAFPGMTLVQVLDQGGGGLNALGRHTVAALLNAATLNYPLTEQQVIDMFNDAFASGDAGDIEALKDQFESFNEAGCLLTSKADFNQDGYVDVLDVLVLINHWGEPEPCDVTETGAAGLEDLLFLLNEWGPTY